MGFYDFQSTFGGFDGFAAAELSRGPARCETTFAEFVAGNVLAVSGVLD